MRGSENDGLAGPVARNPAFHQVSEDSAFPATSWGDERKASWEDDLSGTLHNETAYIRGS